MGVVDMRGSYRLREERISLTIRRAFAAIVRRLARTEPIALIQRAIVVATAFN